MIGFASNNGKDDSSGDGAGVLSCRGKRFPDKQMPPDCPMCFDAERYGPTRSATAGIRIRVQSPRLGSCTFIIGGPAYDRACGLGARDDDTVMAPVQLHGRTPEVGPREQSKDDLAGHHE